MPKKQTEKPISSSEVINKAIKAPEHSSPKKTSHRRNGTATKQRVRKPRKKLKEQPSPVSAPETLLNKSDTELSMPPTEVEPVMGDHEANLEKAEANTALAADDHIFTEIPPQHQGDEEQQEQATDTSSIVGAPVARLAPILVLQETPQPEIMDTAIQQVEVVEVYGLQETPQPEIMDTPIPSVDEEEEDLQKVPQQETIATLLPPPGEEDWVITRAQQQVVVLTPLPTELETPEPALVRRVLQPLERLRVVRKALAYLLLVLLVGSFVLLWHDVTDTHLYLYTLNPDNGEVLAQQDMGGGYQDTTAITEPVLGSKALTSLLFGVQSHSESTHMQQQVLMLSGSETSWHVDTQFSAQLSHGTLSLAPTGELVVENASSMQVMTTGGHFLWQAQGDQPTLGAHPFQPAFDETLLYTTKSASAGVVAAYDMHAGSLQWTQKLDDTLMYAPPFLLHGDILYIAGDHNLYALQSSVGKVLWKRTLPARTLLMRNGDQQFLLAAGASGLIALNPITGTSIWSFSDQPHNNTTSGSETLMPAQFYQASFDNTTNVVYATGIVWDAQQVREQLWLYAVDASTGSLRWSERTGTGFVNADAGRIYPPFVDTRDGLVILQQAQDDGAHTITAFNTGDGLQRWNIQLEGVTSSAPTFVQASSTALILLNTQSSSSAALHSWSLMRRALIAVIGLSMLGLLLLWAEAWFPLQLRFKQLRYSIHNAPRNLIYPLKLLVRFWRFSHKLFALTLLVLLVGPGALAYVQLSKPQSYLVQLAAANGNAQWQHTVSSPDQLALAGGQRSIVTISAGENLHQLSDLDASGVSHWTTFASEGAFSLPLVPTPPETVLVALSGHTPLNYQFAPDDPAYPHPLDHLFTLYLLDRATGQAIWQSTIVPAEEQQNAVVLGADTKFIYVASITNNSLSRSSGPVVQLLAVDQASGNIEWRIFGPHEPNASSSDYGKLFLQNRRTIFWQVSKTVIAIDATLGQMQWRRFLEEENAQIVSQEETQMAETAGVLLVERRDLFYALDPSTGNQLWNIRNPGANTSELNGGIVAVHNIFLIYGGGILQAVDPYDQHIIWNQKQQEAIQGLKISDDGTMAYVVLLNNIDGIGATQLLVAFDVKTGAVRWTFQPFNQEKFVDLQSDGFQYRDGMLFATICLPANHNACDHEMLYAIHALTGQTAWKFGANSIYNVQISPDASTVTFQTRNSDWANLLEHFRS